MNKTQYHRLNLIRILFISVLAFMVSACSDNDKDPEVAKGVQITVDPTFGKILTDETGRTLYFFSNDFGGTSTCNGGCLTAWPLYFVDQLTVGAGLDKSDFGVITRADGQRQTTYKGWPLYYYELDQKRGDVTGDKSGNIWYVAKPDYSAMLASRDDLMYLVAPKGKTLYVFTQDAENTSACTSQTCVSNWPVFINKEPKVPSFFASSDFGTFQRADGTEQSTFKGRPLYYYVNDIVKGDAKGHGLNNGAWLKVDES